MRRVVLFIYALSALLAFSYVGFLSYLFLTLQLPHGAALWGIFGVLVGTISVSGVAFAKLHWDLAQSKERPFPLGYVIAASMLVMVGAVAAMKRSGDLNERTIGPFMEFLDLGFYLGLALGVCTIAAFWLDQKPTQ